MLFLLEESEIRCQTLRKISNSIGTSKLPVILAMPDTEYIEGRRGFAKAKILATVTPQIRRIIPLSFEDAVKEITKTWGDIHVAGEPIWVSQNILKGEVPKPAAFKIAETKGPADKMMMARAKRILQESNCWMDPAGSVFAKDGQILTEAASTGFSHSDCKSIPGDFSEIAEGLTPGERMFFCDSLHSERVAISRAADLGISLHESTLYVTKYPCRSCTQSVIAAGVRAIVFERGSYGLLETADLVAENSIELKRVVD